LAEFGGPDLVAVGAVEATKIASSAPSPTHRDEARMMQKNNESKVAAM
jgi:hypothetical protein